MDTQAGFRDGFSLSDPMPKAHLGVLVFLPKHDAAVFFVNSGQIHLRQTGTEDLCLGFAAGAKYGKGLETMVFVKSLDCPCPKTRVELEKLYAEALISSDQLSHFIP